MILDPRRFIGACVWAVFLPQLSQATISANTLPEIARVARLSEVVNVQISSLVTNQYPQFRANTYGIHS